MHCIHKSTSATTMSINHSNLSKKLRKAAINQAAAELVSAKQSLGHEKKASKKQRLQGRDSFPSTVWSEHIKRCIALESCQGIQVKRT